MGAVSVSVVGQSVVDNQRVVVADVTFSNSYATGGDTVALGKLGLAQVNEIHLLAGTLQSRGGVSGTFTPNSHGLQLALGGTTNAPKLKAFNGSTSEVTAATDLSAKPAARVEFRGV